MKDNTRMLQLPLILGVVLYGGFYSFCAYAIGVVVLALLFVKLGKDKKSRVIKNEIFYGGIALCIAALISVFIGIDKGMAWLGFLRVLVIFIWAFYLMQFTQEEREDAITIIPWINGIIVIIGIISLLFKYILPNITALFWQADRFGGTFQYSNTCALFLLLSILILSKSERLDKKEVILFDILLLGIFLTGSKGGILFLIPVFIWTLVKNKLLRKNALCMLGLLIIGGVIYVSLTGDFQNIGRIYTVFSDQSTLFGRLLYMKDALPVLVKNPLGIGYMGYYAIQSSIQTGVYTSMFVHNDWMQLGLDYGWLFLFAFAFIIIMQLVKGKQDRTYKISLIIVCLYSFMEFHLQYLSIIMIVFLLLDYSEKTIIVSKKIVARENQIFAIIGVLLLGYFAIQSLFSFVGNQKIAISMFPYDTQAKEIFLQKEENKDIAVMQAKDILTLNPYSSYSYNVLAYSALMDSRFDEAINCKFKVVELKKYNMTEYRDFLNMLTTIQMADDSEYTRSLCSEGNEKLNRLIKKTEDSTSDLAYKLRDKPVFMEIDTSIIK